MPILPNYLIPILVILILAMIALKWRKRRHGHTMERHLKEPTFEDTNENMEDELAELPSLSSMPQANTSTPMITTLKPLASPSLGINHNNLVIKEKSKELSAEKPLSEPIEIDIQDDNITPDVITILVVANKERPYFGYEMLQTLLTLGLRYGKMNIFHRHEHANGQGEILFSLASMIEPGVFELSKIGGFTTPGLVFFMRLKNLKNCTKIFDLMLDTARQLVEELGGVICNEKRLILTPNMISELRVHVENHDARSENLLAMVEGQNN